MVPAFCALAVAGMFAAVQNPGFQVLKAVGKPKALLVFQAVSVPAMLVGVWVGMAHGVFGVALGYSAATILLTGVNLAVLSKHSGVRWSRALGVLLRAAIPIVASLVVFLTFPRLVDMPRPWLEALLGLTLSSVVFLVISRVVVAEAWTALRKSRHLLVNRVNKGNQPA